MRSSRRDPVDTLPSPGDAFEVVILRQPGLPQGFEHAGFLSLQNALVNGARASEAFNRQGLPLTARAQDVNAGIKGSTRCPKASDTAHAGNLRFVARFAISDLPNSDKPRWENSASRYSRIRSKPPINSGRSAVAKADAGEYSGDNLGKSDLRRQIKFGLLEFSQRNGRNPSVLRFARFGEPIFNGLAHQERRAAGISWGIFRHVPRQVRLPSPFTSRR